MKATGLGFLQSPASDVPFLASPVSLFLFLSTHQQRAGIHAKISSGQFSTRSGEPLTFYFLSSSPLLHNQLLPSEERHLVPFALPELVDSPFGQTMASSFASPRADASMQPMPVTGFVAQLLEGVSPLTAVLTIFLLAVLYDQCK
jgi:hypothetical protein